MIQEPKSTLEAMQWVVKILGAKYDKADLNAVIADNCKHLSVPDQEKLMKPLTKFEDLFDGTLGDWDTEHVSLKLKEGAKLYHSRPLPTPKAHKETLKKEVQRLCELEVLKWKNQNQNGLCLHLYYQTRIKLYDLLVILGE